MSLHKEIHDKQNQIIELNNKYNNMMSNMNTSKAKALAMFISKYNINNSIRLTEDNFSKKKNIKYIPIYATFCLKDL